MLRGARGVEVEKAMSTRGREASAHAGDKILCSPLMFFNFFSPLYDRVDQRKSAQGANVGRRVEDIKGKVITGRLEGNRFRKD